MWVLLGTVFVASLLGSLHCVGMCGPFALLASASADKKKAAAIPSIAYSLGRLLTYSIVGAIFGSLGFVLNAGTSFASWQQSATYVAGGLMITIGIIALARHLGMTIRLPQIFSPIQKLLQTGFEKTRNLKPFPRALSIGALTSLMPCGWLYTFAITAAGTGSPLWGTLLMATFWAGTVPIMMALMFGFHRFGTSIQKRLPVVMASLVILLGGFTIAVRAPVFIGNETQVVADRDQLINQVQNIDHDQLPCCAGNNK